MGQEIDMSGKKLAVTCRRKSLALDAHDTIGGKVLSHTTAALATRCRGIGRTQVILRYYHQILCLGPRALNAIMFLRDSDIVTVLYLFVLYR